MEHKRLEKTFDNLITRQNYLVVQANDLAKAFGNLKSFEHEVLEYCFSYVTSESKPEEIFVAQSKEILKLFRLNASGSNYKRIVQAIVISITTTNELR